MFSGKDTDLLILEKLNDKDLLNLCLTNKDANKLCDNEDFWRNRFIKKWGNKILNIRLKKGRTWKKFYLMIIKYLDSEEEILTTKKLNEIALKAGNEGDTDIVEFAVNNGANNLEAIMKITTDKDKDKDKGNLKLIKILLKKDSDLALSSLPYVVSRGKLGIVKLILADLYKNKVKELEFVLKDAISIAIKYRQREVYEYLKREMDDPFNPIWN